MRFRRRIKKVEVDVEKVEEKVVEVKESMREHKVEHAAELAADEVARKVFESYSANVERKLALLEAQLEVATGRKRGTH